MTNSTSKISLIVIFIMIYGVNAYFGWPIVKLSGMTFNEYADLAAIIQSGSICAGKLDFLGYINLLQPLPENCGGYIYGRPLLALLALSAIPISWTIPLAILLGITVVILIAHLIAPTLGSNKVKIALAIVAVFSPGVFLLFERANFDLLMLIGVVSGAYSWSKGRFFLGLFLVGLTSVLKYYTVPLLLIAPFLFGRNRKQVVSGAIISVSITLYAAWDFSQLPRVPGVGTAQFGWAVLPSFFSQAGLDFSQAGLDLSSTLSIGLGIVMPLVMGFYVFRYSKKQGYDLTLGSLFRFTNLSSSLPFITLSTVFVSCFFAGLNYDYRLIFLAIPAVILLQRATGSNISLYLLNASLLVALWGSATLGAGLDLWSDQLDFVVLGLQLAGDIMVFVWTGLLLGLVTRMALDSDFIKKRVS